MAVVRYEPWSFVNQLQEDVNKVFRSWSAGEPAPAGAEWQPAADVEEYADHFELFVDMPGVPADQVEITLEAGVLTLAGERKPRETAEQALYRRAERGYGRFHRRFVLPKTANAEGVEARAKDGVLAITIPKQAAAMPRKIEIAA